MVLEYVFYDYLHIGFRSKRNQFKFTSENAFYFIFRKLITEWKPFKTEMLENQKIFTLNEVLPIFTSYIHQV